LLVVVAAVCPAAATAAPGLLKGIDDNAQILYGNPDAVFADLHQLRVQIVRIDIRWDDVAGQTRTVRPTDPNDGQYDWTVYDRAALFAARYHMQVLFAIVGTPAWANDGAGANVAPDAASDLRDFAYAAATRYSGTYKRPADGVVLPAVRYWLAWNEPNNPVFLSPQYRGRTIVSGRIYAGLCNAVVAGVHATLLTGERVGCGATAPRGNNNPSSARPSVSPLPFLRAMKAGGARGFDAYAHHPYYGATGESPTSPPRNRTEVAFGELPTLERELARLYPKARLWITEYGYQTNPPDDVFGVTYRQQARWLQSAFKLAKRDRRIDMFVWFLLRDEPTLAGWQSGLQTMRGARKPAWAAFRALR
jgi:hypothetical protein